MLIWDDVVGHEEKRMLRLPQKHQLAYGTVCVDHAFFYMEAYLAAKIPKKSHALVKQAVKVLWDFLAEPGTRKPQIIEKRIEELNAIWPDNDDPVHIPGWGDILQGVIGVYEMANGEDPKELLLDSVGYAYQGVRQMAKVLESKRAKTTESAIRGFEKKSPLCQAEMKFQLACLQLLEFEGTVESVLFLGKRFPPR